MCVCLLQLFIVITQPAWVSYSSHVTVYSANLQSQEVVVISQDEGKILSF